ncbi:hypothetical protein SAMN05421543_12921 [Alicyclobacillus macrosporangiidus]|uniref:Uncharacterized protein n=1 Tax=Alicyclobacillus macrosporangiidus TaxID=392015 RepID=A0A1I7L983_9BACL|nr:hypothetical protein SAMN05421543_12921 [Alicyclobacillus macrosporangiidus]
MQMVGEPVGDFQGVHGLTVTASRPWVKYMLRELVRSAHTVA